MRILIAILIGIIAYPSPVMQRTAIAATASNESAQTKTISFTGFDFVLPEAWADKVKFKDDQLGQRLEWDGWYVLARLTDGADVSYYPEYETYTLGDGKHVVIRRGTDFMFDAEISDDRGHVANVYLQIADNALIGLANRSEEELTQYREMQASITDLSPSEDAEQIAVAALRACVERIRFDGDPIAVGKDGVVDLTNYSFTIPKAWRDSVSVEKHGEGAWIKYGNGIICMLSTTRIGSDDDWVSHVGVLEAYELDSGFRVEAVRGEDWTINAKVMTGVAEMPYVTVLTADYLRDRGESEFSSSYVDEYLKLQAQAGDVSPTKSSDEIGRACLRACAEAITPQKKAVTKSKKRRKKRIAKFTARRDAIEDEANNDPRLAGTMTEMRAAGADRLDKLDDLMDDLHAWLAASKKVDFEELEASQRAWSSDLRTKVQGMGVEFSEESYSGNAYGIEVIAVCTDATNSRLNELFDIANQSV